MGLIGAAEPVGRVKPGAPVGSTLARYLSRKAGGALISLAMVVVLGFFSFRVLPGSDPAINLTRGRRVSAEEVERLRGQFGLDKPLAVQFLLYDTHSLDQFLDGRAASKLGNLGTTRSPEAMETG